MDVELVVITIRRFRSYDTILYVPLGGSPRVFQCWPHTLVAFVLSTARRRDTCAAACLF